ncbi:hypothetical protein [Mangrovicoccus sp. HB161399]|uniref:hypothetical protein n=1 Tax=Mangrovicoccus sp. HB161399 TaxID=2720392 RepID=UPI0015555AC1|nr:hypothetical protein [Mangrovicoccus sp. HB161399]
MMMKPFDAKRTAAIARRDKLRAAAGEREAEEAKRLDKLRAASAAPEACGFDAPAAPARGKVLAVDTVTVREGQDGKPVYETTGYRGRSAMRAEDALDRIKGLTEAQRAAGRRYAALVEAVEAGGMKCSSSGMISGGGNVDAAKDFMDVYMGHCDTLRRMNRAIGDGIGMPVRRVRPSDRGTKASISDRKLVEMVCLGGEALVPVLDAHGWVKTGRNVRALACALAVVLERLRAC